MQNKSRVLQYGIALCLFLVLILFSYWLNQPKAGQVPTAASLANFARAEVRAVIDDQGSAEPWTEGLRLGTQDVVVKINSGQFKGIELRTYNYMSAYGNIDLKVGSKIIVRVDLDDRGQPYVSSISNYDRSLMIGFLVVMFILALVAFGGRKGLSALGALIFTMLGIWYFLIPLIQRGVSPILAAIILVSLTTVFSLVALNGLSRKTLVAIIGCVGGVTIAGTIAMVAAAITPISGFNMPEAEELVLRVSDGTMKISGLLVSGILIAALGAVMDVALTIASAIEELHLIKPTAKVAELFKAGLNIGRDAMGTMADTLILAFAGASLNMLVLFRIFDYPLLQVFNSDLMAIEIIQGLSGSIGVVLTVPLVATLGAAIYGGHFDSAKQVNRQSTK